MKLKKMFIALLSLACIGSIGIAYAACEKEDDASKNNNFSVQHGGTYNPSVNNPIHTHVWDNGVISVQATCDLKGEVKYTCGCGESFIKEIPAIGHHYVNEFCEYCKVRIPSEGLQYRLSNDETYYSLTGLGSCEDTDIVVPAFYNQLPIKEIKASAFEYQNTITSVVIPDFVMDIGDYAFRNCTSLTNVKIGESVINIGEYAFVDCDSLSNVHIPNSVKKIGDSGFYSCEQLEKVTIGNSLEDIGPSAFWGCILLTEINIPESVTSIGSSAFRECDALTSVQLPDSLTEIDNAVFYGCDFLRSVSLGKYVTHIGASAFQYCGLLSIDIPDSVIYIGDNAFNGCWFLVSATIGKSVETIGDNAFAGCRLIEIYNKSYFSIKAGNSAYGRVGEYAKDIYIEPYTSKLSIDENGCIIYTDGDIKSFIGYMGKESHLTLPEGITEINKNAIGGFFCPRFTVESITIPNSVIKIGNSAFEYCQINIIFEGTVEEWNGIEKETYWNSNLYTEEIVCSDGTVTL